MKKIFILLPILFGVSIQAQNKKEVSNYLENKKNEILQKQKFVKAPLKFDLTTADRIKIKEYLSSKKMDISVEQFIQSELNNKKQSIVSFVGNTPIYNQLFDIRANKAANVDFLYEGTVNGNSAPVTGDGVNITIIDGGSVLNHVEFSNAANRIQLMDYNEQIDEGDTTAYVDYNYHATNVAGVIGAAGVDANARGVLKNSKFKSYAFNTTVTNGDNYSKTLNSDYKLSNHSYGANLGYGIPNLMLAFFGYVIYPLPIEPLTDNTKTYSGTYFSPDYNWDYIVDADPNHVIVKAAGNSFGMNKNNVTYFGATSFIGYDLNGNQYEKSIGEVNDSVTITLESLPSGNCEGNKACIDFGSLAKNIITVGSIEHLDSVSDYRYNGPTTVQYSAYSSAGPRKDGAIKPDISTVGSDVYMPTVGEENTIINEYDTSSGTSFSSPLVTGVIGALTQFKRDVINDASFNFKADGAKNLITHTAQESGLFPGPDVFAGWGIIDGNAAAELLVQKENEEAIIEDITIANGTKKSYEVYGKANTPLKASIVWIDPAANHIEDRNDPQVYFDLVNDTSNKLVNDFDLRVIDTETNEVFYPWKLDVNAPRAAAIKGDNNVDNVEQILVEAPVENRKYKIEISHKGHLINHIGVRSNRNVNLIVSGYSPNSLGLNDVDKNNITIYPTKTKGLINFTNVKKDALVEVYTITGQKIKNLKLTSNNQINLDGLGNGVYIITIKSDGQEISKKVIKY